MKSYVTLTHENGCSTEARVLDAGPGEGSIVAHLVDVEDCVYHLRLGRDGRWYDNVDDAFVIKERDEPELIECPDCDAAYSDGEMVAEPVAGLPPSGCPTCGARDPNPTAASEWVDRLAEIRGALADISDELMSRDQGSAHGSSATWADVGDLNHVKTNLSEIVRFLKNDALNPGGNR